MMRKLLVAAGISLAALFLACTTSSTVSGERKITPALHGTYCDPDIKIHQNPILFVHGMHEGQWVWEDMSHKFCNEYGYSTYRFDLQQYVDRDGRQPEGQIGIFDYVADVERAIDEVTQKYGNAPILFGHSLGGLLALQAGAERDVKSLVLIAPAPPSGVRSEVPPWFAKKGFIDMIRSAWTILSKPMVSVGYREVSGRVNEWSTEKQKTYFRKLVPESSRIVQDIVLGSIKVPPDSISAPILVISGSVDDIVPVESSRRVAEKYNADFMEFPGNGHFIIIEPGWEDVADAIRAWLLPAKSKTVLPAVVANTP